MQFLQDSLLLFPEGLLAEQELLSGFQGEDFGKFLGLTLLPEARLVDLIGALFAERLFVVVNSLKNFTNEKIVKEAVGARQYHITVPDLEGVLIRRTRLVLNHRMLFPQNLQ